MVKTPETDRTEAGTVMTPAVCAALGTALAYYGTTFFRFIGLWPVYLVETLLFLVIIISIFGVLVFGPFVFFPATGQRKVPRIILKINLLLIAGSVGFCLGIAARASVREAFVSSGIPVIGLSGVLREDPRSFNDGRGMGSMELREAALAGGIRISQSGTIPVFFPRDSISRIAEFGRGSEIYVEGDLIQGDRGQFFRAAQVHIVKPASMLEQFRTGLRSKVLEKFGITRENASLEPPVWAGLASAMLLGIRDDLDADIAGAFRNAGCSHILALSGMHLAVLSAVIAFLFRGLGVRAAALAGSVFIIVYIFIAGGQPSLVRAGIMFLLGTAALWGRLKKDPLALLALAFMIQLIIQSESGKTVSFMLSYLSLAGILISGESIRELLRGKIPGPILTGFAASTGAFIAVAGISVYYFGELYPVGIAAGLVVIPLSSLFMLLVFLSLVLVTLIPILFPALDYLLTLVFKVLEFFVSMAGKVPGFEAPSFLPVLVISLALAAFLEMAKYRNRRYGKRTAPFEI